MPYYIVYAAAYCLWIILYSIFFFALVYIDTLPPVMNSITAYARLLISAAVVFSLPMLVSRSTGSPSGEKALIIACISAVAVTISAVINIFLSSVRFASILNILYNGFLFSLCLLGIIRSREKKQYPGRQIVLPFYILSGIFYPAAAAAGIVLTILGSAGLYASSFAVAAYCLPWSILMIGRQSSYILSGVQGRSLPETFLLDFGITPREKEIVEMLLAGKTNNQIARESFISLKTVETHIYNIYRKCGITKKMELNNLINTYR
jgi:DNA-binding CsgD family transcriptional regulator